MQLKPNQSPEPVYRSDPHLCVTETLKLVTRNVSVGPVASAVELSSFSATPRVPLMFHPQATGASIQPGTVVFSPLSHPSAAPQVALPLLPIAMMSPPAALRSMHRSVSSSQENLTYPRVVYDRNKLEDLPMHENALRFDSRFECGNLGRAIQTAQREYDLLLTPDTNATHHTQW